MTVVAPDHVPPERIFDFDFRAPPMMQQDIQAGWHQVRRQYPPIFWTPRYGGHWVVTRGADIKTVESDVSRFSSRVAALPYDPQVSLRTPPFDMDPPEHTPFRKLIAPSFMPRVIAEVEGSFREIAIRSIEGFRPRGHCEFVGEFASVLPVVAFLSMMDLPIADAEELRARTEPIVRGNPETKRAAILQIGQYLAKFVAERTHHPADDPISRIVSTPINGETIPLQLAVQVTISVLVAGLDTVASLLGFVARFLADHPAHRRRLIEEPAIRPRAVEEFFRRFGIVNHARLVKEDTELAGVVVRAGDIIQLPTTLVGLDDDVFPDPLVVDFDRPRREHALFGNGPHRCPGAVLAHKEMLIFLDEWLGRIPDFEVKPGAVPVVTSGTVSAHQELWLSWPPRNG